MSILRLLVFIGIRGCDPLSLIVILISNPYVIVGADLLLLEVGQTSLFLVHVLASLRQLVPLTCVAEGHIGVIHQVRHFHRIVFGMAGVSLVEELVTGVLAVFGR